MAAGHPEGEASGVVVATVGGIGHAALAVDGAAEFAAPDDEGLVEQAALLEIGHERGGGLIGVSALLAEVVGQVVVVVPAHVVELHETDAALDHAACEQAVACIGSGLVNVGAVQVENVLGFVADVGEIGHGGLHAEREFVLLDARQDFRVVSDVVLLLVKVAELVEHLLSGSVSQPAGLAR